MGTRASRSVVGRFAAQLGWEIVRHHVGVAEVRHREAPAAQVSQVVLVAPGERDRFAAQSFHEGNDEFLVGWNARPAELGPQVWHSRRLEPPQPAADAIARFEERHLWRSLNARGAQAGAGRGFWLSETPRAIGAGNAAPDDHHVKVRVALTRVLRKGFGTGARPRSDPRADGCSPKNP